MRSLLFLIFLTSFFSHVVAQIPEKPNLYDIDGLRTGEWILYYDSLDHKVSIDSTFVYCTLQFEKDKPKSKMECFYTNGVKQWEGKMSSIDPDIKHGPATFYYPLGNIQQKANFVNNVTTGELIGYYENGQLQYKGSMKDDKNTGYWEYFHPNGKLMSKGIMVEGLQNGYWEFYLENGQIQTKGIAKNGMYNGEWTFYFANGNINQVSSFIDHKREGLYTGYHENGNLAQKGNYSNDRQHGDFTFYHQNGQLESEGTIREGLFQGPWNFYYTNGIIASNRVYVDDKENGYFKYYFEDGTLKSEGNVTNEQWDGDIIFYHANGKVQSKGKVVNGLYQGAWKSYFESGNINALKTYVNDSLNGNWEMYFDNGQLREKGKLVLESKEDYWIFYFANGQVNYKGNYANNLKDGYFEYFNEDGSSLKKVNYSQNVLDGYAEFNHDNGALKSKGNFKNGNREDHWVYYHDNGNLSTQGKFEAGKSQGMWKYYYSDGTLKSEGMEVNDNREGLWQYYHPNGKMNYSGLTKNGDGIGIWSYYDTLGRLTEKGKWLGGSRDSTWIYYDTLGRHKEIGAYVNGKVEGKWWIYKNGKKDHKEYWDRGKELNYWNLRDSSENVALKHQDELAFKIAKAAKKQWKKTYSKDEIGYHNYWRMMANINRYIGEYKKADEYYLRTAQEAKRIETDTSWNFAISNSDLAINYYAMSDYQKSVDHYEIALDIVSKTDQGKNEESYFQILNQLATAYIYNKEPNKGIAILKEDLKYRNERKTPNTDQIAQGYGNLAELYYRNRAYDSALNIYYTLFKYLAKHDITDHYIERNAYRQTAYVFGALSNEDSAIYYYKKAMECHRRQDNITSTAYALNYTGIAAKYYDLNNIILANQYSDTAIYLCEVNNLSNFDVYHEAFIEKAKSAARLYKYQLAVDYYKKAEKILKSKSTLNKHQLSTCLQGMALAYEELHPDDFELAEKYYLSGKDIFQNPTEYKSNFVNGSLLLAIYYKEKRLYNKSKTELDELKRYYEKLENPDTYYHGRIYQEYGRLAYAQYQYDSAKIYFQKSLTYFGNKQYFEPIYYANVLDDIADIDENMDRFDEAQKLILIALDTLENNVGKDHTSYISQLHALAVHHRKKGNYASAIALMKQVKDAKEKIYGRKNTTYTDAVYTLLITYRQNDQYDLALKTAEEMKNNVLSYSEEVSNYYIYYLEEIGSIMSDMGNFDKAKQYFEEMLHYSKLLYGAQHETYAYNLREAGRFYYSFNKYEKALTYLKSAVNIIALAQGTQNQKYAWSLETLGNIQFSMEHYKEALSAKEQIIEIYKNVYGELSEYHIDAKSSMANLYYNLGRYNDSELMYKEVLMHIEESFGINSLRYAEELKDISYMYRWWEKPEQAIEQAEFGIQILDSLGGTHEAYYYGLYNAMGLALQDIKRFDESKTFLIKARDGALKNWGKTESYFTYTNNLAFVYVEKENYKLAEELLLEAGSRFEKYDVVNDLERVNFEDNLAALYLAWGKMDLAEEYWNKVTNTLLHRINSNFSYMSESEKTNFWDAYKKDFEYFNSYAVKASTQNSDAIGQMYDNQLQTKSILLSSSTKERTKIMNSGDSTLVNTYFDYIDLKESLSKYYGYSSEQILAENVQIDSLELVANDFEKALSLNANDLVEEEKAKKVRWKDIQRKLKDHEAAVEIIRFRHFDKHVTDSVLYAALILTSDTRKNPELVMLPNGNELETRFMKNYLTSIKFKVEDKYSFEHYWKKIDEKLKGKSVVYFSPDGVFNQINVNTFSRKDGTYIIDDYNVHILTSTKDVLLLDKEVKKSLDNQVATLFGFPKYDLKHSSIENLVIERSLSRSRNLEREIDLTRFGFSELPGTKTETQSIADILNTNNWETDLYLADEALEEVLKSVNSPNVLHIATHGFFLDDIEGDKVQLGVSAEHGRKNPLLRSGLLLAGAAQTVQGDFENKTENGIFTAYEAMNLDLKDTDLVVLSACETGRGEVKSGEGVYGLQRAFQVAGAESLIMSLWKVNDDATQLLMTNFYKNWIAGQTKNEAFKQAQLSVRTQFPEPYYWGAFVMVGN